MRVLDWNALDDSERTAALERPAQAVGEQVTAAVAEVLDAVRERGADAVVGYTERFDGVRPTSLRVPPHVLEAALDTLDDGVRAALEISIERARAVHADQRRVDTTTRLHPGGTVTERWVPVERVGLYVPGGRAVYPSSVVMNVVPAQLAGVGSIAVASPPQRDNVGDLAGYPHPTILAACALLGVDEVWAMGGAQAVAALALMLPLLRIVGRLAPLSISTAVVTVAGAPPPVASPIASAPSLAPATAPSAGRWPSWRPRTA